MQPDTQNENDQNVTAAPAVNPHTADAWPGAFAAYGKAYEGLRKNSMPALLVVGIYIVVALLSGALQHKTAADEGYKSGEAIVGLIFLLALPLYAFAVAEKRQMSIQQFMKPNVHKYFVLLFTSILASFAVVFSLALLLIPVIWVLPWVYLATYAAVDKELSPVGAIKYSKQLTRHHKGKVWGLIGAGLLLTLCSLIFMIVPVVGMFLGYAAVMTVSLTNNAANAMLYRWLQKNEK
jgi:hypothetical protein